MKTIAFFLALSFIIGCTYVSTTTMNAQAGKLVSPYGVLTNGTMNITREMSWGKTSEDK